MSEQAQINPTWKWKWVIMSIALALFGVWCIHDATNTYPANIKHGEAFDQYKAERDKAVSESTKAELDEKWEATKKENGWEKDEPEKRYTVDDIATQWTMLYICAALAVACVVWLFVNVKQKLYTTEQGLTGPGGSEIPYESMKRIDKELWVSKGIAYVEYEHDGKEGRVKIDDWIYQGADRVLEDVEQMSGIVPDDGDEDDE